MFKADSFWHYARRHNFLDHAQFIEEGGRGKEGRKQGRKNGRRKEEGGRREKEGGRRKKE